MNKVTGYIWLQDRNICLVIAKNSFSGAGSRNILLQDGKKINLSRAYFAWDRRKIPEYVTDVTVC